MHILSKRVLFLDELPEFSHRALEVLRQPLEDGCITISRAAGSITYPSKFMMVAAMNPCPCGYYGHPNRKCNCSPGKVDNYLQRISGPMLNRIDLIVEVAPVEFVDMNSDKESEPSASIRERVQAARDIQQERFKGLDISCNANITADNLREFCPMTPEAVNSLDLYFKALQLSGRTYNKLIKVARTIADMAHSEVIKKEHITEAAGYRSASKYWKNA